MVPVRVTLDSSLHVGTDGYSTKIADVLRDSQGKLIDIYNGEWHTIKNGKETFFYGNYDGTEKPGTNGFEYEYTPFF